MSAPKCGICLYVGATFNSLELRRGGVQPGGHSRVLLCQPAQVLCGVAVPVGEAVHGIAVAHHALHQQGKDGIVRESRSHSRASFQAS